MNPRLRIVMGFSRLSTTASPPASAAKAETEAPLVVRTSMKATVEMTKSSAWITRGKNIKATVRSPIAALSVSDAAMIMDPTISAEIDSNRSAPRPAQSPTLSPTRSAMTAGLRGSSSGMPASTLPTRSAPTSAPLV
eukprot:Amastigsp_a842912_29.p4 type:complete len:137 gc:universal Amastigsp_a842912_29:1362-952(-)